MYESSTKGTKWVCIQLACSRRPRALEEAHCWNIQAKFYNEKFPLSIWKWQNKRLSIMKIMVLLWSTSVAKDSSIVPSLFFSLFFFSLFLGLPFLWPFSFFGAFSFFMAFLFFIPHMGECSRKLWSSHFYLFTTQWLQLDTRTKDDSIWMPPAVYRDMQWTKSDMYQRIMNGGFATNIM